MPWITKNPYPLRGYNWIAMLDKQYWTIKPFHLYIKKGKIYRLF